MNGKDAQIVARALNLDGGEGSGVKGHTTEKQGGLQAAREKAYATAKAKSEKQRDEGIAKINAEADRLHKETSDKRASGEISKAEHDKQQTRTEAWRSQMTLEHHGAHEERRRALVAKHGIYT